MFPAVEIDIISNFSFIEKWGILPDFGPNS